MKSVIEKLMDFEVKKIHNNWLTHCLHSSGGVYMCQIWENTLVKTRVLVDYVGLDTCLCNKLHAAVQLNMHPLFPWVSFYFNDAAT